MSNDNAFRLNHVGYLPKSRKAFVIVEPPGDTFQVFQGFMLEKENGPSNIRRESVFRPVYEGKLRKQESELPGNWQGDFSHLVEPANYYLQCGDRRSRGFVVYDKVYDVPARAISAFFNWQRCGHPSGWAGACHKEDGVIWETGEKLDLAGGHHQSCDHRKSIDGISIGFLGLIRYAMLEAPSWDNGGIAEEIRWTCDYQRKLIHPAGCLRDGLFQEVQDFWGARYYYDTPAAPSEQWHGIRLHALAARYFRDLGDRPYSAACLGAARRIWNYMVSDQRRPGPYQSPVPPPYGLGRINKFYTSVYKDSADDIALRLCAAADLFRVTGEPAFREDVAACATRFAALQVGGREPAANLACACFREAAGSRFLAGNTCNYTWVTAGPLCLCEALDIWPEHPHAGTWEQCLRRVAQQHMLVAARNVWQRTPNLWRSDADTARLAWQKIAGKDLHPGGHIPDGESEAQACYYYGEFNGFIVSQALLLAKAAALLNEPGYLGVAQRQLDWLLGANPYDASCVTGVGYNHFTIPMWAVSPPVPQIPGGVTVGMASAEYEIPVAGQLLGLMAEMRKYSNCA